MKVEKVESFSVVSAEISRQVPLIGFSFFSELQEHIVIIKTRIDNAFFNHDLNNGKDSTSAVFFGGGGKYTLKDSVYTENLEYFNNRQWENGKFEFVVKIKNDTLTQKGIEKVEKLGINRIITERYVREK